MATILDYSEEPKYNIKAVSQKTGILPVTIRAWERRHHLLNPERADNRYRLYSDRDIALLTWIKQQTDSGVSISSAVNEFHSLTNKGISPEAVVIRPIPLPAKRSSLPPGQVAQKLYEVLIQHDENQASELFSEALASFDLLTLFEAVITPCLVMVGESWYRGEIKVATEHFASGFIRAKLMAIYQDLPTRNGSALILVGGAPGELHEIGPLITSILLRNIGFKVEFLGPDIPLEDLALYARDVHPRMIILSATLEESVHELKNLQEQLDKLRPRAIFGFGGAAFNRNPGLIGQVPGNFLGKTFGQSVETVRKLLIPLV